MAKFGKDSSQRPDPNDRPNSRSGGGSGSGGLGNGYDRPQYGETDNRSSRGNQNRLDAKMDQRRKDAEQERRTADRELSQSKGPNGRLAPKPIQSKTPGVRLGQPLDPVQVGVTLDRVRPIGVTPETDGGQKGGAFGASRTDTPSDDVAKPVKPPVQEDDEVVPQVKFTSLGIPAFLGGLPNNLFKL